MSSTTARALILAVTLVVGGADAADAQEVEVGTSLSSVVIGLGDNDGTIFGVPSGGFGLVSPGTVYASFFTSPNVSIEPQLGLIWTSSNGRTSHVLSLAGQFNYFPTGSEGPYLFASLGVFDSAGNSANPGLVGVGLGYRRPLGGRLVFRFDGRVLHVTDDGGNTLTLGISIGGIFGR